MMDAKISTQFCIWDLILRKSNLNMMVKLDSWIAFTLLINYIFKTLQSVICAFIMFSSLLGIKVLNFSIPGLVKYINKKNQSKNGKKGGDMSRSSYLSQSTGIQVFNNILLIYKHCVGLCHTLEGLLTPSPKPSKYGNQKLRKPVTSIGDFLGMRRV